MKLVRGVAEVENVDAFVDRLRGIGAEHGCALQAFDARLIADRRHLESAVEHADRAFERNENVAHDRAVEILLYAAGRRQISRALDLGIDAGRTPAVVVIAADPDAEEADTREAAAAAAVREADLLDRSAGSERTDGAAIRSFFGITDAEIGATAAGLGDLVRERVALLDVEK